MNNIFKKLKNGIVFLAYFLELKQFKENKITIKKRFIDHQCK